MQIEKNTTFSSLNVNAFLFKTGVLWQGCFCSNSLTEAVMVPEPYTYHRGQAPLIGLGEKKKGYVE